MRAPLFEHWQPGDRWAALAAASLLLVVAGLLMARQIAVMKRHGGVGIVPFELARDRAASKAILDAWGETGQRAARWSLLWDVPFLVGYVLVPNVVTGASADVLRDEGATAWAAFAALCGWAYVLAGALDLVENALLYLILRGDEGGWLPRWASRVACVKFWLFYGSIPLVVTAGVAAIGV